MAHHDLVFINEAEIGLRWDNEFAGLGTSFTPWSLSGASIKRNTLLGYNPNLVLLASVTYRDAPVEWLAENSPWWMRAANGQKVGGWNGNLMLDWHNSDYRTQVVAQAKALMDTGIFDGIMLDWWDDSDPDRITLVQEIRGAIGDDKLILVNTNQYTAPHSAAYVNGLFMEAAFNKSYSEQINQPPNTPQEWKKLSDTVLWAEANLRKPQITSLETDYLTSRNDLNRMRATTTLMLTHSNGYVLFAGKDPPTSNLATKQHIFYPFWDKTLGKPIATMIKRPDGAFQREFDGGTVIYNPMGNGAIKVVFTETRRSAATGQSATTFTLDAMDGDLYLK